ncbi:MAG TPA: hypothetical protein VF727_13640 [Allosphingosinicella sp.]|jgi:hypothetical protein
MEYQPAERTARQRRLAWILVPLVAFLAGLAAMGWVLVRWETAARYLGVAPEPPPVQQAPAQMVVQPELPPAPQAMPGAAERLVIDPEITRRVNLMEERLAALDAQSRAAVGNADRAEGLLVAFAARRALDRGVPLGYLETLLRERFAQTQAQAVATILTEARQPVTLQELQEGLQKVAPELLGGAPEQSWWQALRTELGGLVTIRREGAPSPMPTARLARATRGLEAGQVDVALLEVLRLPGREKARDWIGLARRYVGARRALDAIETAALIEPRIPAQPRGAPAR